MPRKKKYKPKRYESLNNGERFIGSQGKSTPDVFSRIYQSMLESESYRSLTEKQKVLYIYCKLQLFGKRKPEKDYPDYPEIKGEDKFYFNWDLAWKSYRLYSESSEHNFSVDINKLVDHGLIDIVVCGKPTRDKSIYRFSDRWKTWKAEKKEDINRLLHKRK